MARKRRLEDEDLLSIARQQFVAEGFGASTRTIAQLAGVSEGVLFQRFRTKAELFFAAMVPPGPDLHAILSARPADDDPAVRFEQVAGRVLTYFREIMPVLLPLVTHPDFSYERFVERYPESPPNRLVTGLQQWLTTLEVRGTLAPGSAGATALALVSAMTGVALFERMGAHGGAFAPEVLRQTVGVIWAGATSP